MTQRILYFDCFSGVAGDMTLAALLDLGVELDGLRAALRTLDLPAWTLSVEPCSKMSLRALNVHVDVGGRREAPGGAHHAQDHLHDHDHGYGYLDIVGRIEAARLPPPVTARALSAFGALAEAEARIHGTEVAGVHFHELGAVDSIIDIVGSAWGVWQLGVDRIESAPPPLGRGFVRSAHGRMPLPAPATLEVLRGVPVTGAPPGIELVTPTGAAFIKAWAASVGPIPEMVVEATGWGAGDADLEDRPNLLRLVLGRADAAPAGCEVVETNVDDLNPEWGGYLLERLFEAGALDAWFAPLYMKKGRPGLRIGALVEAGKRPLVEAVMLSESTAIGVRRYPVVRRTLPRRMETVSTPFGPIAIKVATADQGDNLAPEYADCVAAARAHQVPIKQVYQHAIAAYLRAPR